MTSVLCLTQPPPPPTSKKKKKTKQNKINQSKCAIFLHIFLLFKFLCCFLVFLSVLRGFKGSFGFVRHGFTGDPESSTRKHKIGNVRLII